MARLKGIRGEVGIIPKPLARDQRRDDLPIPFGRVANEILSIDGQIHCLAQPQVTPRTVRFPHVEKAKHRHERPPVFHHLRKGALRHPQRL